MEFLRKNIFYALLTVIVLTVVFSECQSIPQQQININQGDATNEISGTFEYSLQKMLTASLANNKSLIANSKAEMFLGDNSLFCNPCSSGVPTKLCRYLSDAVANRFPEFPDDENSINNFCDKLRNEITTSYPGMRFFLWCQQASNADPKISFTISNTLTSAGYANCRKLDSDSNILYRLRLDVVA